MRLLIALAALAIPFASSPAHGPGAPAARTAEAAKPLGRANCPRSNFHYADKKGKAESRRLGELPPGDLILAVVRNVDGCQEPVIVRQNYGFDGLRDGGEPERPRLRARRW